MRTLIVASVPVILLATYACSDYDADPVVVADAGADTAAPVEAGSDATVDAGPSGFCSSKGDAAVFCEDFDSITDVSPLVPSSTVGDPDLSAQTFVSGPRSLRFLMPDAKPAPQYSVVTHGVATDKDVRFEVDWRWQSATTADGQTVQSLTLRKDTGQAAFGRACGVADAGVVSCFWYISVNPNLSSSSDAVKFEIPPPAALTKWSHIVFQVRFASSGHVLYEEDGVPLVDVDTATLKAPSTAPTAATIGLAILQGSTTYQEMFFDNMVLELR